MNMVLERSGYRGTGSDMARSFAGYGQRVSGPQVGAIAVMSRGRGGGHVGVVSGIDAKGNPIVVSGNNGNRVREAPVSRGRIYAYVMPTRLSCERGARRCVHGLQQWLLQRDRIADRNRAARDHLGIDAAFVVAEPPHQRLRDSEVARGGVGIDVDGRAAGDPLHHFQPRGADGEGLVEQVEFVPGRPAARHRGWRGTASGCTGWPTMFSIARRLPRLMIETTLRATSEKLWPSAGQHLRRTLDRSGVAVGEKPLDGGAALGGFEIALSGDRAVPADGQDVARIVEMGVQRRQPFVPHQHQEMGLQHPLRIGGIEAAGAVFDGIAAVGRKGLADGQRDPAAAVPGKGL